MPDTLTGTNLDPWLLKHRPEFAAAHQRLFGRGAKLSGRYASVLSQSLDEAALATRPRSATAGEDVNLPALSNVADYAVTPTTKPPARRPGR